MPPSHAKGTERKNSQAYGAQPKPVTLKSPRWGPREHKGGHCSSQQGPQPTPLSSLFHQGSYCSPTLCPIQAGQAALPAADAAGAWAHLAAQVWSLGRLVVTGRQAVPRPERCAQSTGRSLAAVPQPPGCAHAPCPLWPSRCSPSCPMVINFRPGIPGTGEQAGSGVALCCPTRARLCYCSSVLAGSGGEALGPPWPGHPLQVNVPCSPAPPAGTMPTRRPVGSPLSSTLPTRPAWAAEKPL